MMLSKEAGLDEKDLDCKNLYNKTLKYTDDYANIGVLCLTLTHQHFSIAI